MNPAPTIARKARLFAWYDRFGRARSKLFAATRNARYIEQLIREPKTIGPEAIASLVQTVNWVIEARCNIRCSCCHYFATRQEGSLDRSFDLHRMMALVDEVPRAIVAITGGEPLMSPSRVAEVAQALMRKNRAMALVTNSLPLTDPRRGDLARGVLTSALNRSDRARLRIQCSVDLEHQVASRLPVEEYVARCHAAIRHLTTAGFPVFTRSITTSRNEYLFFKEQVLPWAQSRLTLGASVQPDIYDLPRFAASFQRQELGDMGDRLGSSYVNRILDEVRRGNPSAADAGATSLRTAPWVFIEIGAGGVRGPSSFVSEGAHHSSVLEMLRSYDWLRVSDSIVPQITICQNAFLYRVDRRKRTVSLNFPYVLGKFVRQVRRLG